MNKTYILKSSISDQKFQNTIFRSFNACVPFDIPIGLHNDYAEFKKVNDSTFELNISIIPTNDDTTLIDKVAEKCFVESCDFTGDQKYHLCSQHLRNQNTFNVTEEMLNERKMNTDTLNYKLSQEKSTFSFPESFEIAYANYNSENEDEQTDCTVVCEIKS